jgi:hypothetical protein
VTLTISVPQSRHFVAVESPLPAGLEPIDLALQTSQQLRLEGETTEGGDVVGEEHPDWWWEPSPFEHTELRDDRVFLFAEHLPAGVYRYEYLVRALTPGRFRLRPARAWEMYYPEVFGQTAGMWFTVAE